MIIIYNRFKLAFRATVCSYRFSGLDSVKFGYDECAKLFVCRCLKYCFLVSSRPYVTVGVLVGNMNRLRQSTNLLQQNESN